MLGPHGNYMKNGIVTDVKIKQGKKPHKHAQQSNNEVKHNL